MLFQKSYQTFSYSPAKSQVLDFYPSKANQAAPLLVVIHGGAFKFGNQKMTTIQPIIEMGRERGFAVASVDYRKSTVAHFPAALADIKGAIRYLKAQHKELGFNPNQMIIWGESAGAYLALMTALTPQVAGLNGDVTNNLDQDATVQALVSYYAPVNFYQLKTDWEALGKSSTGYGQFESDFLGTPNVFKDYGKSQNAYWKTYQDQLPDDFKLKAWIQVGDEKDDKVPYLQSVHLAQDLKEVPGLTVNFQQLVGAGHEDPLFYTKEHLKTIFDGLQTLFHDSKKTRV